MPRGLQRWEWGSCSLAPAGRWAQDLGLGYVRLDGSTAVADRLTIVDSCPTPPPPPPSPLPAAGTPALACCAIPRCRHRKQPWFDPGGPPSRRGRGPVLVSRGVKGVTLPADSIETPPSLRSYCRPGRAGRA